MIGFVLLIVAIVLSGILFPIGFIYAITKKFFKAVGGFFFAIALSIDQSANVICSELFNDVLLKNDAKNKVMFGDPDKTISFVLGKNLLNGSLNRFGIALTKFLNLIEKDHVFKAIQKEEKK